GSGGSGREAAERRHEDEERTPCRGGGQDGASGGRARRRGADEHADDGDGDGRGEDGADQVQHGAPPRVYMHVITRTSAGTVLRSVGGAGTSLLVRQESRGGTSHAKPS